LGTIKKDYNHGTGSDCFAIDNKRMSDKRQRGNATTTKDVNKAFKIITREFHAKTTEEALREARETVRSRVTATAQKRSSTYQYKVYEMQDAAFEFAVANWEAFAPFARDYGVFGTTLDTFHESRDAHREGEALKRAYAGEEGSAGMLVVLRGSDYIVQHGSQTTILTQDQLTPYMKRCIGMLKLAEKGTFIPGMGVKAAPDTVFIMPEQKEDEASD
jgi:hypothetical protein